MLLRGGLRADLAAVVDASVRKVLVKGERRRCDTGDAAREAREEPRAQVEVGAPTEEDDHHRGIVVKVVGVEEGDAWGRRVCVVCAEEKERRGMGGRGVRRRLRGFAGGEGGPILPRSISPKIV